MFNAPHPDEVRIISKRFGLPNSASIETYLANEGYQAFMKAVEMTPEQIIEELKTSSLRGRGGAGFPTGMKWSFIPRDNPKPKYVVVNADESEPGTCKDRLLIQNDPHQLIEGCLIAARTIGCKAGYIYIRGEYRYIIDIMDKALAEAYREGWLGKNIKGTGIDFDLYTHTGAGAYECGEESALLESLEGKRGVPASAPVPGRERLVCLAHRLEQRRDFLQRSGHHSHGRQGLCGYRHPEKRGHSPAMRLRPRESAGCL